MKLTGIIDTLSLTVVAGDAEREAEGVYAGDFLSRAMSHIGADDLWITIMNNVNVIAVASLTDAAAVLLAENVALAPDAVEAAKAKDVTVLSSDKSVYELCAALSRIDGLS